MIDLDELERLDREATPGPWELWEGHLYIFAGPAEENSPRYFKGARVTICDATFPRREGEYRMATESGHAVGTPESDFALIVAARNALPDLIAELRMLRAERTPFHAMEKRLADSIEGGVEAGIALIKARAYEQGRQDALRGVQAAALYRHAELWLGRMRLTSADERRDIEACELAWAAAQAAEEIETQKGAGDDFDAMVRELRTLRARVTELERDARLGAVVREAVGCMNAYMVEGHTTAPGFTLRQERIISVHQLNVLRAIADALRAEEAAMTPEDRRERGRR